MLSTLRDKTLRDKTLRASKSPHSDHVALPPHVQDTADDSIPPVESFELPVEATPTKSIAAASTAAALRQAVYQAVLQRQQDRLAELLPAGVVVEQPAMYSLEALIVHNEQVITRLEAKRNAGADCPAASFAAPAEQAATPAVLHSQKNENNPSTAEEPAKDGIERARKLTA